MASTGFNTSKALTLSLFFGLFLIFGMSSCEKRVPPSKVQRIISKDSWRVSSFTFEGQSIASEFVEKTLGFDDEKGDLTVIPYSGVKGKWRLGSGKKPTLLYIYGFLDAPYFNLNDDWSVVSCSNSTIRLESESGSYLNKITLIKVEE